MNKHAVEACGLGEAIHTAFRKATDCKQAAPIHDLIEDMPARDWKAVLEFVYASLPRKVQQAMDAEGEAYAERHGLG